jgi:uncharacterized protein YecE (DUF72 family)
MGLLKMDLPGEYRTHLRIGTCSWKYDSWKGLVYDENKRYRSDDYLQDYARRLSSVEVDQWFWSLFPGGVKLPDLKTTKSYAASVPGDFVFTVKAPNSLTLTHYYSKQSGGYSEYAGKPNPHFLSVDLLHQFLERLEPLGSKLGPIMLQFEYLNRQKMASKEAFFEQLGRFLDGSPKGYKFAVETRNPNYLSPPFFDCLREHDLGFVYLEGYYMPPVGEIFEKFKPVTADFCIIRLHGGDRMAIESETGGVWNGIVSPKPQGLKAAVRIVRHNTKKKILTYVNVNNHFEGSAPLTIERFIKALGTAEG